MDAVGRLAGGVAHDFNNILTVIMGYSDLLIRHLGPAHALIRHVREIRKASERAGTLTQQLLAFSRQQVLQPKRLNLNTVIRDLSTMLHRLIGEDVELVLTLDPELGFAHADPGTLEQTLMNLAINARDAMAGGGRLMIGTTNTEFAQPLTTATGTLPAGSYVALRAADTGSGMDADILSKIFEPFFTTKEPGKGTGLGLAMVHGIVSQIGGAIDVKSQPGLGTTFTIYLPRAIQAGSLSAQPPLLPATHAMRGTETVLLVEDEEQVRAMAREILGAYGYTVVTAADGMEGLEQAKTHAGPIHLLLTDVVMPKMRGRELAELVSMLRTDVKVLYMSGYTDDPKLQQDVTGHHSRLLRKPFSPTQLLEAVRETLGPLVGSR
jgi:CheY-like chemotaxis protein